ncbi:MAG TPA: CoA pyrophosphatase [Candidatus Polarisedimenticolia bacterium]|nr:CoA pyrophosphatase [Candidatus Polarisedimenticolia bacterium]
MIASLRDRLAERRRRVLERSRRAAVLVPIVEDGGALRLILTRRTDDLPTHAGQVAFPGGLMEPGEVDPARTALREAEEEIGLPADAVDVLGRLDDFPTRTDEVAVTPVVGLLRAVPPLRARAAEVARIFDIPIADLAQAGRWTWREERRGERRLTIYYFEHQGETLWGLSARIVLHLLEVSELGSPVPLGLPEYA